MKKIFKKKDNSFNDIQYMSNGNLYETFQKLKTQKNIDLANIKEEMNNIHLSYLKDYSIPDWYLLLLHSNYYSNTIMFECNDFSFRQIMIDTIRKAWIDGKSGIYFNTRTNKAYNIDISNIEYNAFGEIVKIKYWVSPLIDMKEPNERNKNDLLTIEGEDCKNVAIFRWGAYAISAYIIYFPFVKYQNVMLKMMIAQTFAFNRKYIYKSKDVNVFKKEMELWYNPLNVFILALDEDFINRFKQVENSTDGAMDFITYYKEVVGCYYALFGRRMNLDFKKERNTVAEVSLTSGAIENVERDWLTQFEIFCNQIEEINGRINMVKNLSIDNIRLNIEDRDKREKGIFDDDEGSNSNNRLKE